MDERDAIDRVRVAANAFVEAATVRAETKAAAQQAQHAFDKAMLALFDAVETAAPTAREEGQQP